MKKNVGKADKAIRIILALIATYFAYSMDFEAAWVTYVLYGVAIVLLLTSLMGTCPLFSVCGINSNKK